MRTIEKLIQRCIEKDRDAWDKFIKTFHDLVYQTVKLRFINSNFIFQPQDLEDVTQNVFLKIWQKDKLKQIRARSKVKAWLCIMSQNYAINYIRDKGKFNYRLSAPIGPSLESGNTLENTLKSNSENPIQQAEFKELKVIIDNVIENLIPKHQLIIRLSTLYQKSHKEIAQILGISVNTVSSIIRRTKKKLKQKLEQEGYNF